MDDALLDVVLGRLDVVPLEQAAERLLLAALEGQAALNAELRGETREDDARRPERADVEPAGAFLSSIAVSGFRGIGATATLDLEPGPGLTLVVGRNGSGKSSFAEGFEVLLTGDLRRWHEHPAWRSGWRNLHHSDEVRVSADLVIEGAGTATAERLWDGNAEFTESRATAQVSGEKRAGLGRLGWDRDLDAFRPFLSHSELEAFFSRPSQLYELLFSVLGLESLTDAHRCLAAARKDREDHLKEVNHDLPALLDRLDSVDDERAKSCQQALEGRKRDLIRALSATSGSAAPAPDSEVARLRQFSQVTIPTNEQAVQVAAALREAADALIKAAGSQAGQAMALSELLGLALKHYGAHGAGPCPVCGTAGALDEGWRIQAEAEVARLEGQAAEARQARSSAEAAKAKARELFTGPHAALSARSVGQANPVPAREAWAVWQQHPDPEGTDGLVQLADHIDEAWDPLSVAVTSLTDVAELELRTREDRWAPVARDVAGWIARAQEAENAAGAVPALRRACDWLKNANDDIRNDRLAPLSDRARAIWSMLRQESNIDLGVIRLSGSNTQRKLDIKVTVDGSPGPALGVMSQGEINALALSIFLPRATMSSSPFRFLIIDDPVQAMDPAKVEGLARVLEDVSRSRQVVVFTHDDRLPEAARRLHVRANTVEVTRLPDSIVSVRPALAPVEQQLKDAYDLCADKALPADVAAKVVPVLCRLATEAAFIEAIRRVQLRSGKRHADLEAAVEAADTLTKKAALAMFGDQARGGEVLSRLNSWSRTATDTYKALNKGAHIGHGGSLRSLVSDARALCNLIREKLA